MPSIKVLKMDPPKNGYPKLLLTILPDIECLTLTSGIVTASDIDPPFYDEERYRLKHLLVVELSHTWFPQIPSLMSLETVMPGSYFWHNIPHPRNRLVVAGTCLYEGSKCLIEP